MKHNLLQTVALATLFAIYASEGEGANILAVFPMSARSHWFALKPLISALSQRGHNITLVVCETETEISDDWEIIRVPAVAPSLSATQNMMQAQASAKFRGQYDMLVELVSNMCEKHFQEESIQKLMNEKQKKFDLLIMEYFMYDCFVAFAHKFSIPVVGMSAFGGIASTAYVVGDPHTPSYVPDVVTDYTDHMTFWQRLDNALTVTYLHYLYHYYYFPRQDEIIKKYFRDPTMPSISAIMANTSLMIVQTHMSFSYPRAHVPNLIETGGMHIQQPRALPEDLKKLMDNSNNGIIYFSMGSLMQSAEFPEETVQAFIGAFSKLKQTVLWKWESETISGKSPNIHLGKWFPQSDLLAHKNIRLFISHGGLQSTLETTARGVPMVGIPVGAEQRYNVQMVVNAGCGIKLDLNNITMQSVEWAISEVLHNPTYGKKAKQRAQLFWDRPQSAVDTAVYWTEYVLRHKGAPHLRSAALDLTWYQYLLLDVVAVLISGVVVSAFIVVVALRKIASVITGKLFSTHAQISRKTIKKE